MIDGTVERGENALMYSKGTVRLAVLFFIAITLSTSSCGDVRNREKVEKLPLDAAVGFESNGIFRYFPSTAFRKEGEDLIPAIPEMKVESRPVVTLGLQPRPGDAYVLNDRSFTDENGQTVELKALQAVRVTSTDEYRAGTAELIAVQDDQGRSGYIPSRDLFFPVFDSDDFTIGFSPRKYDGQLVEGDGLNPGSPRDRLIDYSDPIVIGPEGKIDILDGAYFHWMFDQLGPSSEYLFGLDSAEVTDLNGDGVPEIRLEYRILLPRLAYFGLSTGPNVIYLTRTDGEYYPMFQYAERFGEDGLEGYGRIFTRSGDVPSAAADREDEGGSRDGSKSRIDEYRILLSDSGEKTDPVIISLISFDLDKYYFRQAGTQDWYYELPSAARVLTGSAALRAAPDPGAAVIATLSQGETLTVIGIQPDATPAPGSDPTGTKRAGDERMAGDTPAVGSGVPDEGSGMTTGNSGPAVGGDIWYWYEVEYQGDGLWIWGKDVEMPQAEMP